MLIDVIFLRLASVLSTEAEDVTVIPGWSTLNTGKPPLDNVLDYLVARRPSKYSSESRPELRISAPYSPYRTTC